MNIIWQLNGLVFNTDDLIIDSLEATLTDFDIDELEFDPESELSVLKNNSLLSLLKQISANFGFNFSKFEKRFQSNLAENYDNVQLMPGMKNLLQKMNSSGSTNYLFGFDVPPINESINGLKKDGYFELITINSEYNSNNNERTALNNLLTKIKSNDQGTYFIVSDEIGVQVGQELNLQTYLFDPNGMVRTNISNDEVCFSIDDIESKLKS